MVHNEAECRPMMESSLGKDMNEEDCEVLTEVMDAKHYKDGEILVREGDLDYTLFILISGKIRVCTEDEGREKVVYTMGQGECAGTRAFVDQGPRKATLKALGDTLVYTLTPERFETLLESHPLTVYKFMRGMFRLTHQHLMRMNDETQQLANYIHKSGGRY